MVGAGVDKVRSVLTICIISPSRQRSALPGPGLPGLSALMLLKCFYLRNLDRDPAAAAE